MSDQNNRAEGAAQQFINAMPLWSKAFVGVLAGTIFGVTSALIAVANFAQVPIGQLFDRAADARFKSVEANLEHRAQTREANAKERADVIVLLMRLLDDQSTAMRDQLVTMAELRTAVDELQNVPETLATHTLQIKNLRRDVDALLATHPDTPR